MLDRAKSRAKYSQSSFVHSTYDVQHQFRNATWLEKRLCFLVQSRSNVSNRVCFVVLDYVV